MSENVATENDAETTSQDVTEDTTPTEDAPASSVAPDAGETAEAEVSEAEVSEAEVSEAEASEVEASDSDGDEVPAGPYPPLSSGDLVQGTVVKLVEFGAFVDVQTVAGTVTGLVHVSEVDRGFVENIYAHLSVGQETTVKVVSIGDDGKIGLSIKQADPDWDDAAEIERPRRSTIDKDFDRRLRKFMHGSQSIQGEVRRQKRGRLGRD